MYRELLVLDKSLLLMRILPTTRSNARVVLIQLQKERLLCETVFSVTCEVFTQELSYSWCCWQEVGGWDVSALRLCILARE